MRLIDKDELLKEINEAIKDFEIKNENDQAFLEGVLACRRIAKFMEEVKQ